MDLGSYDSPTFLGQKDKYLLGLSLPELLISLGIAFCWFIVSFLLPYSLIIRLILITPVTLTSLVLLFGRIAGISIPSYLFLSMLRTFRRPSFEETGEVMVQGHSVWLESQRNRRPSGPRGILALIPRKRVTVMQDEVLQAEMKAEMDRQVTEGAVAAERWVRDGIRTMMRGS